VRDVARYLDAQHPMDAFFPPFDGGGLAGILTCKRQPTPSISRRQASATVDEWGCRIPPVNSMLKQGAIMPIGRPRDNKHQAGGDADVIYAFRRSC
jgi:hypothetical protein